MNAKRIMLWLAAGIAIPLWAHAETLDATLHWGSRAVLGMPVSGVIARVTTNTGDRVRKGQALLSLDPRPLQLKIKAARARVDGLTPDLDEARRELTRAQDLYDRTLLSDHDLQLAKAAVAKLAAQRRVAEARVAEAQLKLDWSVLRAPFDGVVIEQRAVAGQSVAARFQIVPLVVLGSAQRLRARSYLPATRLTGLKRGDRVSILIDGQRIDGAIDTIGVEPVAAPNEQPRYALDVLFEPTSKVTSRIGAKLKIELP